MRDTKQYKLSRMYRWSDSSFTSKKLISWADMTVSSDRRTSDQEEASTVSLEDLGHVQYERIFFKKNGLGNFFRSKTTRGIAGPNLPSRSLSALESCVLNLRLGFVPEYCSFQTRVDLFKLFRQIKLKPFFKGSVEQYERFHVPSSFNPSINEPLISTFENGMLKEFSVMEAKFQKGHHNLTKEERFWVISGMIVKLLLNQKIKGEGVIILNTTDNEIEVFRQLNNTSFYKPVTKNSTPHVASLIKRVVEDALAYFQNLWQAVS